MRYLKKKLRIIYEDKYFVVVNKPAQWVVQGTKSEKNSLFKSLKEFIKIRESKKGEVFLGVVHRLDKVVSGAVVLAKRSKVAKKFLESFKKGEILKVYIAVVEGCLLGEGLWENYLKWNSFKRKALVYEIPFSDSKIARTFYKVIFSSKFQSLVLLSPLTGRKHQLRGVLEKVGHPILGDIKYGSKIEILRGKAILLHSLFLSFPHPLSGERMEFWAELPSYFPKLTLDKTLIWEFLYKVRNFQGERLDVPSQGVD